MQPRFYQENSPMKKQVKKLVLAKETVRDLGMLPLRKAAGGSPTDAF